MTSVPVSSRRRCSVCERDTLIVRAVPAGGSTVAVGRCQTCDVRQCEHCRRYVADAYAKVCPYCGSRF